LRERYEQLRGQTGTEVEATTNRSLLQREGMKAWMEAGWREVARSSAETPPQAGGGETTKENRKQIVVLLAGMVVGSAERSWR
jgi:hypothetical protein